MKLICWWLGTDALTLVNNPPSSSKLWHIKLFLYRIKWKLLRGRFEHWSVHKNLNVYLELFNINAKLVVDPPMYPDKVEKKRHEKFNVLYYRPKPVNLGGQKYIDWYYGYEIFTDLKDYFKYFPLITFIETDGTTDMRTIYPYVDCYIRPNNWDGMPRMVLECQLNDIPYMWCDKMNEGHLDPKFEDFKNFILSEYESWKMRN